MAGKRTFGDKDGRAQLGEGRGHPKEGHGFGGMQVRPSCIHSLSDFSLFCCEEILEHFCLHFQLDVCQSGCKE